MLSDEELLREIDLIDEALETTREPDERCELILKRGRLVEEFVTRELLADSVAADPGWIN